jgi:exosortase/archaeosortase family protein
VARAWLVFVAVLAALLVVIDWQSTWIETHLTRWTASLTAASLRLLGVDARADGVLLHGSLFSYQVIGECTAVIRWPFFLAAVVAHPSGPRPKAWAFLLGIPALVAVNQVRLVSLAYVGRYFPRAFETIHIVVWQSLIVFLTLLLWLAWASRAGRAPAPPEGGAAG